MRTSVPVTHNTLYQLTKGGCMKIVVLSIVGMLVVGSAGAAETNFGNPKGFGWQERARVCVALTEEQCTAVVQLQSGGGDGSGAGDAGGDAGAGASGGGAGATGGDSGGNGCGAR